MRRTMKAALMLMCMQAITSCGGGGGSGGTSAAAEKSQGIYGGIASTGESLSIFVLSDGRFWIFYTSQSVGGSPRGFVSGDGNENGTAFTDTSATDFRFDSAAITPSALAATVQAQSSLTGTLRLNDQVATFNAFYAEPPSPSSIGGSYQVILSQLTDGVETFNLLGNLTVSSSGAISGTIGDSCTVSGSAKPRGDINVHDLSLKLSGTLCPKNVSLNGIARFEKLDAPTSSTRQMTGFVTSSANNVGYLVSAFAF